MDDLKDSKASYKEAAIVISIIKDELQKLLDDYKEIDSRIKEVQEKLRELENNESILMVSLLLLYFICRTWSNDMVWWKPEKAN